jgi:hypothetical protein
LCKFLPISPEPGWFCTLALKSKPPNFFEKINFGSATCHFFTKQVGKKRESAPLGREREFSGVRQDDRMTSKIVLSLAETLKLG